MHFFLILAALITTTLALPNSTTDTVLPAETTIDIADRLRLVSHYVARTRRPRDC